MEVELWSRLFFVALGLVVLFVIINLVRIKRLKEEYALLWLLMAAALVVAPLMIDLIDAFSFAIGIDYPPALMIVIALICFVLIFFQISVTISRFSEQIKVLAQELALIENLQREDLNPLEAAEGLQSLITKYGLTQDQLAEALGMKRSSIANTLRLLDLPDKVKRGLAAGEISPGHAKVLLSLSTLELQEEFYKRIKAEGLSVRALEQLTAAQPEAKKSKKKTSAKPSGPDPETAALQDDLTRLLGTKVTIVHNHNKGVIHIHFYSPEDFDRLRDLFRSAAGAS